MSWNYHQVLAFGIETFFGFCNLSVCNSFVLSSVHCWRKGKMLEFYLELAKQLINGFSQWKRHSLEGPVGSVVGLQEYVSAKVEGRKRSVFNASELEGHPKVNKSRPASSANFVRSHFAELATMTSMHKLSKLLSVPWMDLNVIRIDVDLL